MDPDKRYDMLSDDDKLEAIRIKKIRQGIDPNTDGAEYQKEKAELIEKNSAFPERTRNFWYHNKWTVIVVSLIVIAVLSLTIQALTAERYDTTVLFCSYNYFDEDSIKSVEKKLCEYGEDIDGDGNVKIAVFQGQFARPGEKNSSAETNYATSLRSRIMSEIAAGENCIFIIQKDLLSQLSSNGVFEDLTGKGADEIKYGVSLENSDLLSGINELYQKDDYYIAIRVYLKGSDKQRYDKQMATVENIINAIKKSEV